MLKGKIGKFFRPKHLIHKRSGVGYTTLYTRLALRAIRYQRVLSALRYTLMQRYTLSTSAQRFALHNDAMAARSAIRYLAQRVLSALRYNDAMAARSAIRYL